MKNSTTNKIEILREIQKELDTRKSWRTFFHEDYITIDYDIANHVIYANWKGYQTEGFIKKGCEKILEAMVQFKCSRILNDNTNVIGIWTPAAPWVAVEWFPRMVDRGLKHFAWINSPSILSQVSANEALKLMPSIKVKVIRTFDDVTSGMEWLKSP
jgi:hypothetical protein